MSTPPAPGPLAGPTTSARVPPEGPTASPASGPGSALRRRPLTPPAPRRPMPLPANQPPDRFYRGGERIARLRGEGAAGQGVAGERAAGQGAAGEWVPEDWIASTTTLFGEELLGLTRLADGDLLRERVAADPLGWLGPEHVARRGADASLLVKLLDAGQRLPVHAHPDGAFAGRHLGLAHGKTEAWVILEAGQVALGFDRGMEAAELRRLVREQDTVALAEAMNTVELSPGDTVLVPAGLPHAIGAGTLLLELQEPTDLSIFLEWKGFDLDGAADGHLGLGTERALEAVDRSAWSADRLSRLIRPSADSAAPDLPADRVDPSADRPASDVEAQPPALDRGTSLLVPAADPFFRAERHRVHGAGRLEAGFGVLLVLEGQGTVRGAEGPPLPLHRGVVALSAHAAGDLHCEGDLTLLRARPPA